MQEIYKAILSGIIQGVTEFLPVSSSGHLAILHEYTNFSTGADLFFDVILHTATLLAVLIFYRNDIRDLVKSAFFISRTYFKTFSLKKSFYASDQTRLLTFIIVGSIPTAFMGLYLKDHVEKFSENMIFVGIGLLVTSFMLWRYERIGKSYKKIHQMKIIDSIIIGIAQGIAIFPGISRSGSTIATGKILGLDKPTAAKYSFLLSIPAISGAFLLEIKDLPFNELQLDFKIFLVGFVSSFISGYFSLKLLIWLVEKASLSIFMIYTFLAGIILIILNSNIF